MTKYTFHLDSEFANRINERCISVSTEIRNGAMENKEWDPRIHIPSLEHLHELIEVSFWASLTKEEGQYHEFSITFAPVEHATDGLLFITALDFTPEKLAKLAPALQSSGAEIGIWPNDKGELCMWGFAPLFLATPLSVRTFEPGQLVVSFGDGTFQALITGSRTEFIDRGLYPLTKVFAARITHAGVKSREWLEIALSSSGHLGAIAKLMRAHGHGGTLLVVPNDNTWIESIDQPIALACRPYDKVKDDLESRDNAFAQEKGIWPFISGRCKLIADSAERSLKLLAQLTAIDGATVVNYDLTVLAFGVKIKPKTSERPDEVIASEPFEESSESQPKPSEGTRHKSATQFVFDQRNSLAIVASQDGRVSVLAWNPDEERVAATRHAEFAFL